VQRLGTNRSAAVYPHIDGSILSSAQIGKIIESNSRKSSKIVPADAGE
jgi:hypothetical protein